MTVHGWRVYQDPKKKKKNMSTEAVKKKRKMPSLVKKEKDKRKCVPWLTRKQRKIKVKFFQIKNYITVLGLMRFKPY